MPTEEPLALGALSEKERKLYDLIAKRFLAVLMPPFEYEETKCLPKSAEKPLRQRETVQSQGWKRCTISQTKMMTRKKGSNPSKLAKATRFPSGL
ncbi:DNA topoisomerase [Bacillus licheniformis]|nr:DNA topoisomerase [Bacillus licheniformis]